MCRWLPPVVLWVFFKYNIHSYRHCTTPCVLRVMLSKATCPPCSCDAECASQRCCLRRCSHRLSKFRLSCAAGRRAAKTSMRRCAASWQRTQAPPRCWTRRRMRCTETESNQLPRSSCCLLTRWCCSAHCTLATAFRPRKLIAKPCKPAACVAQVKALIVRPLGLADVRYKAVAGMSRAFLAEVRVCCTLQFRHRTWRIDLKWRLNPTCRMDRALPQHA